ncbi:MAG: copper chaperone PCu(A)C [Nitrososphaerota archaeon]
MGRAVIAVVPVIAVAAAAGVILFWGGPVLEAHDVEVRLGVGSAAVFLTIHNHGLLGDCLTAVNVLEPRGLSAGLHQSVIDEGGVMRMVKLDKICIGGLSEVKLAGIEEGGLHIMVLGGTHDVKELKIELVFESGRKILVHAVAGQGGEEHNH